MAFGGETAESYYDEGLTASMRGELERAAQCFERALQLDGAYEAARHQLGKCKARMGQGDEALSILRDVITRKPQHIAARVDYGFVLLGLGRTEQAKHIFTEVVSYEPSNARGYLGLGQAAFREGDYATAMANAQMALKQGGSHFSAYFLLGRAALPAGNPQAAEDALEKAESLMKKSVELKPDHPESHYFRGEAALARGQYANALEYYREAEKYCENDRYYTAYGEHFTVVDILAKQGLCYQKLGQTDQARALGQRVAERDPEHALGKWLNNV